MLDIIDMMLSNESRLGEYMRHTSTTINTTCRRFGLMPKKILKQDINESMINQRQSDDGSFSSTCQYN